jgi:hypothetical protein
MAHKVTIAGQEVSLEWTQEAEKRFHFRMGEAGGEPTPAQLRNPRTAATAFFKVLWALLPLSQFSKYPDPESLFVAVDHETEAEGIFAGIAGIYADRFPSAQKKRSKKKSPSRKSS